MRKPTDTRRTSRLLAGAFVLAFAGVLGGCSSFSAPSWDPTDLLDFLDTKKRAPGERKPVFPEGVPGISQGVPKEMIRGSAESRASTESQAAAGAPPPEAQPAPPPARRTTTAAKRPARGSAEQTPVEIAPDDVNVEEEPAPPPRRQAQRPQRTTQPQAEPQANPFPAPLPR
jgi:hypothetical protein